MRACVHYGVRAFNSPQLLLDGRIIYQIFFSSSFFICKYHILKHLNINIYVCIDIIHLLDEQCVVLFFNDDDVYIITITTTAYRRANLSQQVCATTNGRFETMR